MVREQAQARGLRAPARVALGWGLRSGEGGHARYRNPELGERSASAPRVRMRYECSLENYACERRTVARGDSFEYRTARYVAKWYYQSR
eukprot:4817231-Pleurochrysis_carterae.AAC.1